MYSHVLRLCGTDHVLDARDLLDTDVPERSRNHVRGQAEVWVYDQLRVCDKGGSVTYNAARSTRRQGPRG